MDNEKHIDIKQLMMKLVQMYPENTAEMLLNETSINGNLKVDRKPLTHKERKAVIAFVRILREQ